MLKSFSRTQATIALSSGEAELKAIVTTASEALGCRSMLEDFGIHSNLRMMSDATAAIGLAKRQGLGKVRHIASADLWLQGIVRGGTLELGKIPGKDNPADINTKAIDRETLEKHLVTYRMRALSGHAVSAQFTCT